MPTKEQRKAELEAQLKALDDEDDEELSVWVRNSDGHETRLSGDRAKRWLVRNGYDAEDVEEATKGDPLEEKVDKARKATKAAPKKVDATEEEPLESEAPAKPRSFF